MQNWSDTWLFKLNVQKCRVMSYGRHADRSYTYTMVNDGQSAGGSSLSVHVNFGTWVFGAVNFGTLNVNFGTCHVRYMIDEIRYMSISVHSATMTNIPS